MNILISARLLSSTFNNRTDAFSSLITPATVLMFPKMFTIEEMGLGRLNSYFSRNLSGPKATLSSSSRLCKSFATIANPIVDAAHVTPDR